MSRIVAVDIETTGLDPERHDIWEIALVVRDEGCADEVHRWYIKPRLDTAESAALRISRFYDVEEALRGTNPPAALDELVEVADWWCSPTATAHQVARLTAGAHLVGASPAFDARFLEQFLRDHVRVPAWRHRLIDVEAMAAGLMGWETPKGLADTAEALDLEVDRDLTHGAIYDALLAMRVYDAVLAAATWGEGPS